MHLRLRIGSAVLIALTILPNFASTFCGWRMRRTTTSRRSIDSPRFVELAGELALSSERFRTLSGAP